VCAASSRKWSARAQWKTSGHGRVTSFCVWEAVRAESPSDLICGERVGQQTVDTPLHRRRDEIGRCHVEKICTLVCVGISAAPPEGTCTISIAGPVLLEGLDGKLAESGAAPNDAL